GDHIYSDVHVSKGIRRWRTAVIVREVEEETDALVAFEESQAALNEQMATKEALEHDYSRLRLIAQRRANGVEEPGPSDAEVQTQLQSLRTRLVELDTEIAPLARASGTLVNERWGLLMRTGNDKSHLARQIERHADIYTSRVSNFEAATPFVYLRSARGSLPHDPS
ncbi:MAG: 5'-nucleotidase domain-containing protein, partial [Planctomycetota bacterium]